MNQAVGPNRAGNLSGRGTWLPAPRFRVFMSEADMVDPGPANTWVIVDEHPDSINDGAFAVKMDAPTIIDFPATYHNNAAGFSFADGHSEIKKWRDQRTLISLSNSDMGGFARANSQPSPHNPDVIWMQHHSTRGLR